MKYGKRLINSSVTHNFNLNSQMASAVGLLRGSSVTMSQDGDVREVIT